MFRREFDKMGYDPDLLLMAHQYQVDDLQTDCIEHLSKNLSKDNVIESWMAGQTIGCNKLKTAAVEFLAQHFNKGDTSDFTGLYQSEKTLLLMEELHQYMFRHKLPDPDQEQIQKAIDILGQNHFNKEHMRKAFVMACIEGNLLLVNWLMDMPAKMDLGIPEGGRYSCYTIGFWLACFKGYLNVVNRLLDIQQPELLKVDAVIEDTDVSPFFTFTFPNACTAFFAACVQEHSDIVKRLLELPAGIINFEAASNESITGFLIACWNGDSTVVNLLLQESINIQAKDQYGTNGFMNACYKGHLSVVKSFLELPPGRFNVDETNEEGDTGLDMAVEKGHEAIAAAIRQYKRDNSE